MYNFSAFFFIFLLVKLKRILGFFHDRFYNAVMTLLCPLEMLLGLRSFRNFFSVVSVPLTFVYRTSEE